jgi:hypothetical protein
VAGNAAEQPTEVDRITDFGRPAITRRPIGREGLAANPVDREQSQRRRSRSHVTATGLQPVIEDSSRRGRA